MPNRRPGLAEVAGMAADDGRGQPDRRAAGKIEIDRAAARRRVRTDRQKAEDAVLLAAVKTAVGHALDLAEGDPAKRPLETGSLAFGARFPAETVGDEDKAAGLAIVGEIAHRNECVL